MANFKTWEDVRDSFISESEDGESLTEHRVRVEDVEKFAPVVERLLKTDYNKINGFSLDEMLSALDSTKLYSKGHYTLKAKEHQAYVDESFVKTTEYNQLRENHMLNEAFGETNYAQAPYPVPSLAFTQYVYERSVVPYFAHVFELGGNQGYVYYQAVKSLSTAGNVTTNDLLASPRKLGKQTVGFVDGRIISEALGDTTPTNAAFTGKLDHLPMPGTLVIHIEGNTTSYFRDFAVSNEATTVALQSINGQLGYCTLNYTTGDVTIEFATAPATALAITADYNTERQSHDTTEIPEVEMNIESERLTAEDMGIKIKTGVQQEYLSRMVFGKEWNSLVDEAMGALYNREIANKVIAETEAAIATDSKTTHDISAGISTGGNNALFNTIFMNVVFNKLRVLIAEASGNGVNKVSSIAIAMDLVPIMTALDGFKEANIDTESTQSGAFLVGTYKGIPVVAFYKTILSAGKMVAIYKSKRQRFLTPYAFGEFIKPMVRTTYDQNNLAVSRRQLIASAAGKVVAPLLAAELTVTGIDTIIG